MAEDYLSQSSQWTPDELRSMADQVADHYKIPKDMFRGLMAHESAGWKSDAANPKSSALGVAQFLDSTNRDYELGLNTFDRGPGGQPNPADERLHPGKAMDAAARLLLKKKGETWGERVKNYGEGTDDYLQLVIKSSQAESALIKQGESQPAKSFEEQWGLPTTPPKVGAGTILAGELAGGQRDVALGVTRFGQKITPPGTVASALAQQEQMLEATKSSSELAAEATPPESFLGGVARGLVRTIPQVPGFMAAEQLAVAPLLAYGVGRSPFLMSITPEAIKAASFIGKLPRIAAHAGLTGAAYGAATAKPGEVIPSAIEEAAGFAVAAPAFTVAGKAFASLAKGIFKGIAKTPINFRTMEDDSARYDVQQFDSRKAAKAAATEGQQVGRVDGKWSVLTSKAGVEPLKTDIDSEVIQAPTFKDLEEVARTTEELPSGTPTDLIETKDGKFAKVPDYSVEHQKWVEGKYEGKGLPKEVDEFAHLTEEELFGKPKQELPPEIIDHQARALAEFETSYKEVFGDSPKTNTEVAFGKAVATALSRSDKINQTRFWDELQFRTPTDADMVEAELRGGTGRTYLEADANGLLKSTIMFFEQGGASDVPHELFHHWGRYLTDDAKIEIGKAFGMQKPEDFIPFGEPGFTEKLTGINERMAKGFEKFWHSGRLTKADLKKLDIPKEVLSIWQQFKEWLTQTYYHLKSYGQTGLEVPLSIEKENFFREALGLNPIKEIKMRPERAKKLAEPKPLTAAQIERKSEVLSRKWEKAVEKFGEDSPEVKAIMEERAKLKEDYEKLGVFNQTEEWLSKSAVESYSEKDHLNKFISQSDALHSWDLERKVPDPEVAIDNASTKAGVKASVELSEKVIKLQAKEKNIGEDVSGPFVDEVKRAWKSDLFMRDIVRAWSHGVEEVTKVINRNDLFRLGERLGMKEEIKEAKAQRREFDILRSIFDRVYNLIDVAKSPNIANLTKEDLIRMTDVINDVNNSVAEWRRLFIENRPNMLKEEPGERMLRQVGTWLEDRLGYSPKAFDKITQAAYKATVNMQHAARRWPVLKPLFELGIARKTIADDFRKALLFGDPDKNVPGLNTYYELSGSRPDLAKVVDRIVLAFDRIPDAPGLTRESVKELPLVKKLSASDQIAVSETIGDIRETLDYTFFKLRDDFEANLDSRLSPEVKARRMKQWDKEHHYHPNYFPHVREGELVVQALSKEGKVIHSTRTDSGFEANRLKEELKKKYPGMRVGDFSTQAQTGTGVTGAALRQFISRIESQAELAGEEVGKFSAIADRLIKEYGLRGHYIARETPEGIPGFEENIGKALTSYTNLFATHMGKMEFLRGAFDEVASLKGYGRIQSFAREWVDLTLRPSNKMDEVIATAKNVAFLKYIGGVFKTAVVTTLDKVTNAYPMMGMYVDNPKELMAGGYRDGVKFWQWEREVGRRVESAKAEDSTKGIPFNERDALRKARTEVPVPQGMSQWEVDGLLGLRKTGQLDAVFTHTLLEHHKDKFDLMSQAQRNFISSTESYLKRGWDKTLEWGGKLIGTTESYGRTTTALSAMRMFKKLGYEDAEAAIAGGRFMLDAHGYYGKMNLPLWMMRDVGKLAKLPFTFRVFEHHYLNLVGSMLLGQQGRAGRVAAAKSLGLLAGLGGMMSLPFFTTAGKLFRESTGADPEAYVRKQLNNIDSSQTLADLFSYGVPAGTIGTDLPAISLRSSTEMGRIDVSELLFGAPGSVVSDIAKGGNAALNGDWDGFFDAALPNVLKNPKRAIERYYYGAIGPSGKKLTEGISGEQIKYGVGEALGQALGFTPSKVEKHYQQSEVAIADKEYWASKRKAIYSRLQKAFNKGDEANINRIFEDIDSYNQRAIEVGPDVVLITQKEIKQSLLDRMDRKQLLQAERLGLK